MEVKKGRKLNIKVSNQNLIIFISSIIFILFANIADLYSMIIDIDSWVPVNTAPLSVGDEYHYYSVLKLLTVVDFYSINNLEFSRIIPYIVNMPIYYIGTNLFDARYGILFVRLFDMVLLFYSLVYLFNTVNYLNKWKNNIYISIISIFVIYYCYAGFKTLFSHHELEWIIHVFSNNILFQYLLDESFIYNNVSMNSLSRAIVSSTSGPIIIFMFAYRLKHKQFSTTQLFIFLLILIFTSFPTAVAFGLVSILLDLTNKVKSSYILKNLIVGIVLGMSSLIIQNYLIFSSTISGKEVIDINYDFNFLYGYLTALFIALIISFLGRKQLSTQIIITLIALSVFQPLAFIFGSEHLSRLWIRASIIPYISLLIYILINYIFVGFKFLFSKYSYIIFSLISLVLILFFGVFSWNNAKYLAKYNERFVKDKSLLHEILQDYNNSIIITNSPNVALLCQLYNISSKPLMGHFSLQTSGYRMNLARTIVNFELLGIVEDDIINNIDKNAPRRTWLNKRKELVSNKQLDRKFYFDNILFMSTYVSYNIKMQNDNMKTKENLLTSNFYKIELEKDKEGIYTLIKDKQKVFIIDNSLNIFNNLNYNEKGKL
jgi:hypothetical protein